MTDGIIFDMDGTLWDSAQSVAESWTQTVTRYPEAARTFTAEDIHRVMGMTMHDISVLFFGHLSEEMRHKVTRDCFEEECTYIACHGGVLYPRLEETLRRLKETAPLYIVSNCQLGYVEAFFSYHKLGYLFADYETYGHTGRNKDYNLRLLVERIGLKHPVYIGDTPMDYEACQAANVPFIHAAYGFQSVPDVPFIRSIDELPSLLEKL